MFESCNRFVWALLAAIIFGERPSAPQWLGIMLIGGGCYHPCPQPLVIQTHKNLMAKLKLDLHDIYNKGGKIDAELNRIIEEAIDRRIKVVEIIPGKGSGQLKKRVLRFLNQPDIRKLYHRVEKDSKNFGRIFVHFRH